MTLTTEKPIKTTVIVPDDSQLGSHIEHIICDKCNTVQMARVLHGYPKYKYFHQCKGCGVTITKKDWKRVKQGGL